MHSVDDARLFVLMWSAVVAVPLCQRPCHCAQESVAALGPIVGPITGPTPATVPGQEYISEAMPTLRDDGTPNGRGLLPPPAPGTYAIAS